MTKKVIRVGLVGSGSMAKCHQWALSNLAFYYSELPAIKVVAMTSPDAERGAHFAASYGVEQWLPEEVFWEVAFDYLIIASPCATHFYYLTRALAKPGLQAVYVEKPLVGSEAELAALAPHLAAPNGGPRLYVGYQFLQIAPLQHARRLLPSLGRPLHFAASYLHSGYLQKSYREARPSRLLASPVGGVSSDLASHALSLCVSFLGEKLQVTAAHCNTRFYEVDEGSELFAQALLYDATSGAVGSVTASRISAGHGDSLSFELYAEQGALRFSTAQPDKLEVFRQASGCWEVFHCAPEASFPSPKVAAGPLRSLLHAHYLALAPGEKKQQEFSADLAHGVVVQELVHKMIAHFPADRGAGL